VIRVERIKKDIEAIAGCSETPGAVRLARHFRPPGEKQLTTCASKSFGRGRVQIDAAGNLHGRPTALAGSDRRGCVDLISIPSRHGGDFDGVTGVVIALELLRSAKEDGVTSVPLELIVFAEEEGPTFAWG